MIVCEQRPAELRSLAGGVLARGVGLRVLGAMPMGVAQKSHIILNIKCCPGGALPSKFTCGLLQMTSFVIGRCP